MPVPDQLEIQQSIQLPAQLLSPEADQVVQAGRQVTVTVSFRHQVRAVAAAVAGQEGPHGWEATDFPGRSSFPIPVQRSASRVLHPRLYVLVAVQR